MSRLRRRMPVNTMLDMLGVLDTSSRSPSSPRGKSLATRDGLTRLAAVALLLSAGCRENNRNETLPAEQGPDGSVRDASIATRDAKGPIQDSSGSGKPTELTDGAISGGPGVTPPADAGVATAVPAPGGINFTSAPEFPEPLRYLPNRSSVTVYLPNTPGARDYRVFAVTDGVKTEIKGETEGLVGATITCAGLRQRNECDNSQALSEYGPGPFKIAACSEDIRSVDTPPTLLRHVEVNGIKGPTVLVVEAVDALCPFTGALGNAHVDVPIFASERMIQATYRGRLGDFPPSRRTFPIRTEQEIRDEYGSLIINGHGHAPRDPDPMRGPFYNLAQPAPAAAPRVLYRSFISVSPSGTSTRPEGYKDSDIFDDFEDETDQFKLVRARQGLEAVILPAGFGPIGQVKQFQNKNWNWYTFNGAAAQMYVQDGELHTVLADEAQDVMASNVIYPKRPVKLPDTSDAYLHISFETQTDATQRRYWWLHLCGPSRAGAAYDGTALRNDSAIVAQPFFMNPTSGPMISMAGWNCLQFVPRSGAFDVLAGGDKHNPRLGGLGRPETDVRILVNRPTPAGRNPTADIDSVILLDPAMTAGDTQKMGGTWARTWDSQHQINGMMLDETMFIHQRTRLDFYVNRTRVVMYANGAQKACDNIGKYPLSMAEAAVGIGHVLYHSSGERSELIEPQWIRTSQNYYLYNTPFTDVRSFDNVGIREGVSIPASFNAASCFDTPGP